MLITVVGAGAVGLACAAALARSGHSVFVLERNERPGAEISARNSGVIHAGIYYPHGSLKAETCVRGRHLLYERCQHYGIPHRRTGKWVVATREGHEAHLQELCRWGEANGVEGLQIISDHKRLGEMEPRMRIRAALWSSETGIVDAHALVQSYEAQARAHGAEVVLRTEVMGLQPTAQGLRIETRGADGKPFKMDADCVVNAAGLGACAVAARAGLDVAALGYTLHPCKGDYFSVSKALGQLTQHLVYPLPEAGGLGIHITFDLTGRFLVGPDATYVDAISYDVEANKAAQFARKVASYLPEISEDHLAPDFAGVRPKLHGPDQAFCDFVIEEATPHGVPGLINLLGIESPGLTAAGAIAERVAATVAGRAGGVCSGC